MRIILLSPPYLPEYMRNARCDFVSISATQWYPILLGYCGAYLEYEGHTVKLIDAPAAGLNHSQTKIMIEEWCPNLIVLYTGRMSEDNDIAFAESIIGSVKCDCVIVGPYANIDPKATLSKSKIINKLVAGEFEHPVGEIAGGVDLGSIKNLIFRNDDTIQINPTREYLTTAQLDEIPFVSRFFSKQLDEKWYKTPSEYYPYIDILTGRGCKYGQCTYCLWVNSYVKGSTYNTRSINNVIEEFKYIEKELPHIRSVMIQDDTFTETRAREFSDQIINYDIKLPWSCYARANMSYGTMLLMKKANCRNIHVGYESGDPNILTRIKKGISIERMIRFSQDAKKAGLRVHADFAFGFPGETPENAKKTVELAYRMNPHTCQFQIMIPFPGTPFYDEMKKNGWLNKDGQPDMPQFTNDQIREVAKYAYKRLYISPNYLIKCICHPYEHFFARIKAISRAIPALFWKKWSL
ncbi:MAG TPA: hypothetical protein DDX37_00310 [Candidatus Omnitrophica bacterium]|nr:hypothetical protein [Candidatus Omnitrophota bacterium]